MGLKDDFSRDKVYNAIHDEEEKRERRQRIVEQNGNSGIHYESPPSKYHVLIKGTWLDVYDILTAYKVFDPGIQHAVKKLLKGGERGYKDQEQDYNEAISSIKRGIELINVK